MKEPWASILAGTIALLVVIIFFGSLMRLSLIEQSFSTNEVCRLELGKNWIYDYNRNVGSTCIKLDYVTLDIVDRVKYNFNHKKIINKYCVSPPGFFELNRWDNGCDVLGRKHDE